MVLTKDTVQVAARKKDRPRALRAADTGFLSEVERRPCGKKPGTASAGTRLLFPIDATESRTELTGAQVQIYHKLHFFPSSLSELKAALQRDNAVKDKAVRTGILRIHAEEAVSHELVAVIGLGAVKVRLQFAVL